MARLLLANQKLPQKRMESLKRDDLRIEFQDFERESASHEGRKLGVTVCAMMKALLLLLLGVCLAGPVHGAISYQRLKSLGSAALLQGQNPADPLLEGSDGALYGTTRSASGNPGVLYKMNKDGSGFQVLHTFGSGVGDGFDCYGGVIEASDGALYGTTYSGGTNGTGVVFKLNKDGTGYSILYNFTSSYFGSGRNPQASLLEASDGLLYGTASQGGSGYGTVFKLNKDGTGFGVLHSFSFADGANPRARLIQGSDGLLYGITSYGGNGNGIIFTLNRDGVEYSVLFVFGSGEIDAVSPTGLIEGSDGALYATSLSRSSGGTVFKLNKDGNGINFLHNFGYGSGDGQSPTGIIEGSGGILYGTTASGGSNGVGTVFKLNKDGSSYGLLRSFGSTAGDGQIPQAGLVEGSDGALYGTTFNGGTNNAGSLFMLSQDGNTYSLLHNFNSPGASGQSPNQLTVGSDGLLYGTTVNGGINGGNGTVFKLGTDGSDYNLLFSFGGPGAGQNPQGGLFEGIGGGLYGTALSGGSNGLGAVFKVNKDGSGYTNLHDFSYAASDGLDPSRLLKGSDQSLYGTTDYDGVNFSGTVFKLNQDGRNFAVLRRFGSSSTDGQVPYDLLEGSDGALYGATEYGGSGGAGTIFKINKDGTLYRILHSFSNTGVEGQYPTRVVEGRDGALYGIASSGGAYTNQNSYGYGTLFKLNKDGSSFSVLHSFGENSGDGQTPGGLMAARDGTFYGTTYNGGSNSAGVVFMLTKDTCGYSVLYSFGNSNSDGQVPSGGLAEGIDGAVYGTTATGGDVGFGTIFRLQFVPSGSLAINTQPQDQTVRAGTNVSFCVSASSALPITYQWRFNGTDLLSATNAVLILTNVQFIQSGAYDVVVTDTNSIVSASASLTVLTKPIITAQPTPTNQTVVAGSTVTMSVSATGTLPISYGWRLNATKVTNIVLNSYTCVYTINNVQTNQAGTYRVAITNVVGNAPGLTAPAVLNVLPDSDHDGIPDDWELLYGLNPADPTDAIQDADGDGLTNWQEYMAGTDPRDPQSVLKLSAIGGPSSNGLVLRFLAVSNRTYTVQSRATVDTGVWVRVADVAAAPTNRLVEITNNVQSPENAQRFYRLITPQAP